MASMFDIISSWHQLSVAKIISKWHKVSKLQ